MGQEEGQYPAPLKFSCWAAGSTNGPSALQGVWGSLSPGPGDGAEPLQWKLSICMAYLWVGED